MKKLFLLLFLASSALGAISDRDKAELGVDHNYLKNGGCESSTTGFSTFHTTFGADNVPTTITSGSTKVSLSRVTSNVLQGTSSCQFSVTTAASSTGHGIITDAMTIKDADLAKMLATQFDYNFVTSPENVNVSGTSTQTIEMWVYNVGLASWYQPAGYRSINTKGVTGALIPGRTPAITFQSDVSNASSKNQYRVAFIIKNDPAGTFSMNLDNMIFGRQKKAFGPAVTDGISYTPTFTGFGTPSNVSIYSKRDGDELFVWGTFTEGTTTATEAKVTLGFGGANANVTIDSTKLATKTDVGNWVLDSGAGAGGAILATGGNNYFGFSISSPGSPANLYTLANGNSLGSAQIVSFFLKVPIQGWSSSVQLSQDTDTRVVAAQYYVSASSTTNGNPINFSNKVVDTHSAVTTGSSWKFTAPVSGFYRASSNYITGSTTITPNLYKNGSLITGVSQFGTSTSTAYASGSVVVQLNAGDYIDLRPDATVNVTGSISIERVSGPSVIAASEKVYLQYVSNGGGSITANTTDIDWSTKIVDSHGAWNGTTFTAPRSDWYDISGVYKTTASLSITTSLYKNTSQDLIAGYGHNVNTSHHEFFVSKYLNAGDQLTIRSDTNATLSASSTEDWISIRSQ